MSSDDKIAKLIHDVDLAESPKMAVTIADALRDYGKQLMKDAETYAKQAGHLRLEMETRQRADKLEKLADAIMDAF
jgi:hypothetical protein